MSSQRRIFTCKTMIVILICSLILGMMVSVVPWLQPNGGLWADISWANLPPYSSQEVPGLDIEVHIVRDYWGVPHIFAEGTNDLYMAMGFAHAQDRLFQLDLFRRITQGKLAELFGPEYIEFDQFNRQFGFEDAAIASLSLIDSSVLGLIESYTEGINRYMETIGTKIPVEIRLLNYFPTPWTAVDSLTIERYLAWQLSGSNAFQDLQMANLVQTYGVNTVFTDLFPDTQYNEEFIVPPFLQSPPNNNLVFPPELTEAALALVEYYEQLQNQNPLPLTSGGSNCWVVNGSYTDSGMPYLASDPHLSLTIPPLWYEAHLVGTGHNVHGITYPGIPFVFQGHNPDIAWGWTSMLSDVTDFYYYTWNPSQSNQYWWQGAWQAVEERNTTILVRVDAQFVPVEVILNYTVHGPLFGRAAGRFALKWTGANGSRTLEALYDLGLATNYAEFLLALEKIECPNLNFLYADSSGNIAYQAAAAQPIRNPGLGPYPLNGSAGSEDWQGFVPFNELPKSLNPTTGFLIAANNRPVTVSYPYYLGYDFDPPYRANRITQLLNTSPSFTIEQMGTIQRDSLSLHALAIKDIVANVVLAQVSETEDAMMVAAANALLDWDGTMHTGSVAATIWSSFTPTFMNETFFDEYFVAGTPEGPYPSITVLDNFTLINYGRWFNNTLLPGTQTRDNIILASFNATIQFLITNLGLDINLWNYGNIHVLWIQHPMADNVPYLNAPRLPVNGSEFTVNYAPGFLVAVGASYRMILDLSDFGNSLGVLPAGQRANGFSAHYMDQLGLWLAGNYHPMAYPTSLGAITEFTSIVHLIPG